MMLMAGLLFSTPVVAADAAKHGRDWYCPEPENHAIYEKHRKQFHDQSADQIVTLVDNIYADQTLTSDQKKEKVLGLLQDFGAKIKNGIGD